MCPKGASVAHDSAALQFVFRFRRFPPYYAVEMCACPNSSRLVVRWQADGARLGGRLWRGCRAVPRACDFAPVRSPVAGAGFGVGRLASLKCARLLSAGSQFRPAKLSIGRNRRQAAPLGCFVFACFARGDSPPLLGSRHCLLSLGSLLPPVVIESMDRLLRAVAVGSPLPGEVRWSIPHREYLDLPWGLSIRPSAVVDAGRSVCELLRREFGAPLYWDGNHLSVGGVRFGAESSFALEPDEMAPDEFRGYYHTHPYPFGIICSYFSDSDFAAILTSENLRVLVAQSGYKMSLLVRVAEMDSALTVDFVRAAYAAFLPPRGPAVRFPVDDVFPANKEMCKQFGLALYDGELWSGLQRIVL